MQKVSRVIIAGSANMDVVLHVARLPQAGETVLAESFSQHAGGKGLNQAVAAARAGAKSCFIGAVGQDVFGVQLRQVLHQAGVDTKHLTVATQATGMAAIGVDGGGHNQIMVFAGANAAVSATQVMAAAHELAVQPGDVCLAQYEIPLATVSTFFEHAKQNGAMTALNPSPFQFDKESVALADFLIVNETELAQIADKSLPKIPSADLLRTISATVRQTQQTLIVTLGAAGVWVQSPTEEFMMAAEPAAVVDTTGAGDCFAGYLCASLAAGMSLQQAVQRANKAAALSVTRHGAAQSMPEASEVG